MASFSFPSFYDLVMVPADLLGMRRHRKALVSGARGRTLEIAAGTGLNLRHYRQVESLVAIDISAEMLSSLQRRVAQTDVLVQTAVAGGELLPFRDGLFDTVVITLSLCTIRDPEAALAEVARVLRADGELRFLEHVRHRRRSVARFQTALTPAWKKVSGGCHLDRTSAATIAASGFDVAWSRRDGLGWLVSGVAHQTE